MAYNYQNPLDKILESLITPYKKSVTDVPKIINAMIKKGIIANEKDITNDHIAFRTLGVENLGIAAFENIFLYHGYQKKDYFFLKTKNLMPIGMLHLLTNTLGFSSVNLGYMIYQLKLKK